MYGTSYNKSSSYLFDEGFFKIPIILSNSLYLASVKTGEFIDWTIVGFLLKADATLILGPLLWAEPCDFSIVISWDLILFSSVSLTIELEFPDFLPSDYCDLTDPSIDLVLWMDPFFDDFYEETADDLLINEFNLFNMNNSFQFNRNVQASFDLKNKRMNATSSPFYNSKGSESRKPFIDLNETPKSVLIKNWSLLSKEDQILV